MSVLAFKDVQSTAKGLIAAHAFFTGETVVENLGKPLAEVEAALRDLGQATIVHPIQNLSSFRNGLGAVVASADFDVWFLFNPEKGTKNIYEMVTNGIAAVIDYFPPNNPNDRFQCGDGEAQIVQDDSGIWGYSIPFKKMVQIS